jgi:hypothetical protein
MARVAVAVCVLILPVIAVVYYFAEPRAPRSGRTFVKPANIQMQVPMLVDIPAITDPVLVTAADARLKKNDLVIGVVAFGEARAYLKDAFAKGMTSHVLQDRIGATKIAVTHCDLTNCTRVLSSATDGKVTDIHCGGWMAQQELALLIGDERFAQSSREIPFDDVPFVISTWEKWRAENPHTFVYEGHDEATPGETE